MPEPAWELLLTVFDAISAHLLSDLLTREGVPTRVHSESPLFGVARSCQIFVPAELLEHARSLLTADQLSDSELAYLATGRLGTDRTG
jgi:putative signal transducing protein